MTCPLEPFDGLMLVRPLPEPAHGIPHVAVAPKHAEHVSLAEVVVPPSEVASCPLQARATVAANASDEGEEWKAARSVAAFAKGDILVVNAASGHVQMRVDGVDHWLIHAARVLARVAR